MPQHDVVGRLVAVQEERVRLLTEDGRGLLLALSHRRRGLDQQLIRWWHQDALLRVRFDGEPNFQSAVIRSIRPLGRA